LTCFQTINLDHFVCPALSIASKGKTNSLTTRKLIFSQQELQL